MDLDIVLNRLVEGAKYAILREDKSDYSAVDWRDERGKPTERECLAEWAVYEADQAVDYGDLTEEAYREAWTRDEFEEAYFEKEFEDKPEKMDALQSLRADIKRDISDS